MSYYGNSNNNNSNNWNSRRPGAIDEVDLSSGAYPPAQSDPFAGPGRAPGPPAYGQPNQQPGQTWQRPPLVSDQIRDASAKQYNDFLEKQGIPSITPEDMEVRRFFCVVVIELRLFLLTLNFESQQYFTTIFNNIIQNNFQILRECGRESLYFRCK